MGHVVSVQLEVLERCQKTLHANFSIEKCEIIFRCRESDCSPTPCEAKSSEGHSYTLRNVYLAALIKAKIY